MKDKILVIRALGLVGNPIIKKLLVDYQVIGLDLRKQTTHSHKYTHLRKKNSLGAAILYSIRVKRLFQKFRY